MVSLTHQLRSFPAEIVFMAQEHHHAEILKER
jgi:hypothetical protein